MKIYIVEERSQTLERNPYSDKIESRGELEVEELYYCSTVDIALDFATRYIDNEHEREEEKNYTRDDEWWVAICSQEVDDFSVASVQFEAGLDWNKKPINDFNIKEYDSKGNAVPYE